MWDPVDIAWVAGILEGEGCFHVRKVRNKYPLAVATVSMTDRDIIERLHEVTGIGRLGKAKYDKRGADRKPTYSWTVAKQRDLARLLLAVAPLMGERRKMAIMECAEVLAPGAAKHGVGIQHGTYLGYGQERRRGLKTCGQCRAANAAHHLRYMQSRKEALEAPVEVGV